MGQIWSQSDDFGLSYKNLAFLQKNDNFCTLSLA